MQPRDNFKNFLLMNNAFDGYCLAIEDQKGYDFDRYMDVMNDRMNDIINSSFTWSETPEDGEYWRKLNDEWNRAWRNGTTFPLRLKSIW